MAISNKLGHMVLTTGNKSEMSVGYATLYGDMCGGYSVLKDIYKTDRLRALRAGATSARPDGCSGPAGRVIPERIITKPPTAELRAGPEGPGLLPPYESSTASCDGLVEDELSPRSSWRQGFDRGHRAAGLANCSTSPNTSAAKRRRASRSPRKAFGRDRRYPITNAFRRAGIREIPD